MIADGSQLNLPHGTKNYKTRMRIIAALSLSRTEVSECQERFRNLPVIAEARQWLRLLTDKV